MSDDAAAPSTVPAELDTGQRGGKKRRGRSETQEKKAGKRSDKWRWDGVGGGGEREGGGGGGPGGGAGGWGGGDMVSVLIKQGLNSRKNNGMLTD